MKKVAIIFISILLIFVPMATPASANVDAKAAIVIDGTSGQVIYQQNANKRLPVASNSKLLTMAVVHDELEKGQITTDTKVKVSPAIAAISNDPNYSAIGLKSGQSYSINELIQAAMVKSADGATLALALAGNHSVARFNTKMRAKAHQIGMHNFRIVNPGGLTNNQIKKLKVHGIAGEAENEMTAKDVAILARYLVQTYPDLLKVTSQKQAKFRIAKGQTKTEKNLNQMLPGEKYAVSGVKINGLKTGTSDKAGACFVSSGHFRGHQIITVVLHANGGDSENRFRQTQELYQMLKNNYRLESVPVPQSIHHLAISRARQKTVITTPTHLQVWTRRPLRNYTVGVKLIHQRTNHQDQLQAPVRAKQQIGRVTLTGRGLRSVNGGPLTYRLQSGQSVAKAGWLARLFNK